MANLALTRQWTENIYELATTDPVMGGPDGVDNRQAKELGARTNWLKDQVDGINRDRTGYAPKANPAFTGTPTAPTANPNTNNTQIATTAFVKTAVSGAETNNLFQKIYVSSDTLALDLTNRQQIIDLFGDKYRQNGYLTFANHNNEKSKITGLPLETRSPIVMTFYMMNGYSIFYCHYVTLNRKFFSVANLNNATYKLNWVEDITNTGEQTINHQLNIKTGGWGKLFFPIDNGGTWRFEINPDSEKEPRFNIVYKMKDNSTRYCSFPVVGQNEVVAYRSWADARIADNFTRGKLTTLNLNDVKTYGVYAQETNRDATTERNYPTNFAGTLLVYPSAYGVMQKYIRFNTGETYQRNMNIDLRTWGEWKRVDGLDKANQSDFSTLKDLFIGVPIPYPHATVPAGCLAMNGQRFDKNRYPKLGQKYPSGVLPDLRGEFIRGWDNGRGVDAERGVLSVQEDAIRNITGTMYGLLTTATTTSTANQWVTGALKASLPQGSNAGSGQGYRFDATFDSSRVVPTANENRPRNIAFHYICLAA